MQSMLQFKQDSAFHDTSPSCRRFSTF